MTVDHVLLDPRLTPPLSQKLPQIRVVPFPQRFSRDALICELFDGVSLFTDDHEICGCDFDAFILSALNKLGEALAIGGNIVDQEPSPITFEGSVEPTAEETIVPSEQQGDAQSLGNFGPEHWISPLRCDNPMLISVDGWQLPQ